jgi:hypothetical protein
MTEFADVVRAVQGGGNAALFVCLYYIVKSCDRLARIEKALERYMRADDGGRND